MTVRPNLLVNIDVPDPQRGVEFYTEALGLRVGRRIGPGAVELLGMDAPIYLLQQPDGSSPLPAARAHRDYARHWTPVHIDVHVDDFEGALASARRRCRAGANLRESQTRLGRILQRSVRPRLLHH